MTAFPTYSTGTVAVAASATSIIGTGTTWSGTNAKPGDDIVIAGHTVVVLDVTDATHLVIDAWPYTTVSAGASYKIIQRSPLRFAGGDAMADVSRAIGALETSGYFVFVKPSDTVPDPSYGSEGQYALQTSTGKLWVKSSGTWNLVGSFRGFGTPAVWSGATAYVPFDVATLAGSSYVCILAHTNHTPPNATYWTLLASIGSTGATGPSPWTVPTAWLTATAYVAVPPASVVVQGGESYVCLVSHTSGTFATDLAASKWIKVTQKGTGDLLSTNNLSDLANAATAAGNLSAVRYASGQGLSATNRANARANISAPLQGHLFGLTLSTAGSSATFGIAVGEAADSTAVDLMVLASAYTKTTSAWAVGSGNGALDTGSIANNTWYHVFEIKRPDTGVVDILISTSATAPTLPTNYTLFRRIGSMKTTGSAQWVAFSQVGDEFLWSASVTDVHSTTQSTTAVLHTLSVPTGVKVNALFSAQFDRAVSNVNAAVYFSSPDQSDEAASVQTGLTSMTLYAAGVTEGVNGAEFRKRTNTSGQIRARASVLLNSMDLATTGWIDARGRVG